MANEMSGASSEEWTRRQNKRNFRAQLARERSETRRALLAKLVAEEEWKLEQLLSRAKPDAPSD